MKTSVILSIVLTMIISACASTNKSSDYTESKYTELASGDYSNIHERTWLVAKKAKENKILSPELITKHKLESFDFGTNMMLQIFIGERNSSGYEIKILKIVENTESIQVHYAVKNPDGIVLTVMTQPYKILQLPKSNKRVEFFENGITDN